MSNSEQNDAPARLTVPGPDVELTGSRHVKFSNFLLNSVVNSLWLKGSTSEDRIKAMEASLEAMAGLAPRDEAEGMLSAQMVACHNSAMECYRRAMLPEQSIQSRRTNLNFAHKLSRTYALHMEALDKHRGKGQQTVRVEHVTVNAGGQAIVGTVHTGAGGGKKSEGQAHATSVSDAPEQEMRSAFETDGKAVPIPGDKKRKM